ncbi:hypothetical protein [Natronomonas sp. EA1]|uniref:hypothetical protein n=1 Tax=Natronomonas sp. EA1 TaxID=3421655 RepID=UPI003EBB8B5C
MSTSAGGKTHLHCLDCGHASPIDGDWVTTHEGDGDDRTVVFECPDCGRTILAQPLF